MLLGIDVSIWNKGKEIGLSEVRLGEVSIPVRMPKIPTVIDESGAINSIREGEFDFMKKRPKSTQEKAMDLFKHPYSSKGGNVLF